MTGPLSGSFTPMVIASAVVALMAVLVMFAVFKTRRRAHLATAAYVTPSPSTHVPRHRAADPDEGILWRQELLEAIEAVSTLPPPLDTVPPGDQDDVRSEQGDALPHIPVEDADAPSDAPADQDDARSGQGDDSPDGPDEQVGAEPEAGSPAPRSGEDPHGEPADRGKPLKVVVPTGPLESLVDTEPLERIVIPGATTPFDAFAPATDGNAPDAEYQGRRRRGEEPASDEDAAAEGTPPSASDPSDGARPGEDAG
ncbi:hypothetical protein FH608_033660 [Nonomuraea phyllanthi]|uniref:Uncharacterized protein n=1 Tax=Nonomuraea phyllanthi TaxID=2219224 RepID=A0A5C4W2C1_9ACTN|nr:hypothetical protein [Nonomuraea phyllanthi]KAB8190987.1 hypothetical protein FH608_033660 [Nonomuraea phyllanthi]